MKKKKWRSLEKIIKRFSLVVSFEGQSLVDQKKWLHIRNALKLKSLKEKVRLCCIHEIRPVAGGRLRCYNSRHRLKLRMLAEPQAEASIEQLIPPCFCLFSLMPHVIIMVWESGNHRRDDYTVWIFKNKRMSRDNWWSVIGTLILGQWINITTWQREMMVITVCCANCCLHN